MAGNNPVLLGGSTDCAVHAMAEVKKNATDLSAVFFHKNGSQGHPDR